MIINDIKKTLFMYRNGVVADSLRESGDPHHTIFGLLLPQLTEIANTISKDKNTASLLWEQTTSRECRLLAPMIFPFDELTPAIGKQWINEAMSYEEIDIVCFKLLSRVPFAIELVQDFIKENNNNDNYSYAALRLILNLIAQGKLQKSEIPGDMLSSFSSSHKESIKQLLKQIQEY